MSFISSFDCSVIHAHGFTEIYVSYYPKCTHYCLVLFDAGMAGLKVENGLYILPG